MPSPKLPPELKSFPRWQRVRACRLHRIFTCMERRINNGQSIRQAAKWFVWYWGNRDFAGHPARVSHKTFYRLFARWKNDGRSPLAVVHRYRFPRQKIHGPELQAVVRAALRPGGVSFRAAYRALDQPAGTYWAFWYALDRRTKQQLGELFHHRRTVARLEKRIRKTLLASGS